MTYHNAVKYILTAPSKNGAADSYERVRLISEQLGSPHKHIKYIRFAGSNGKTVCQTMLSRILTENELKVGSLYMPAGEDVRENIRICAEPISMQDVVKYVSRIAETVNALRAKAEAADTPDEGSAAIPEAIFSKKINIAPTKNELIFLVALLAFADAGCSICLIECDHNGTDPTKMLEPPFSTIICGTIPGENTKEITRIHSYLKRGTLEVVSAPQNGETYKIISSACARINCRLSVPPRSSLEITRLSLGGSEFVYRGEKYTLGLCGRFQVHNAATVLEAVRMLERSGFKFDTEATKRALASTTVSTKFETLSVFPTIIADSTHKSEAVDTMCRTLADFKEQTGTDILLCISTDKELINEYVDRLGANGYTLREIILVSPEVELHLPALDSEIKTTVFQTHKAAAKRVLAAAKEKGFVLITGDSANARIMRREILRILEY